MDLLELLNQWRLVSEREGQSIQRNAWAEVAMYQTTKLQLQALLQTAQASHGQKGIGSSSILLETEGEIRRVVNALVAHERENEKLLKAQLFKAKLMEKKLKVAKQALKKLRNAYTCVRNPIWQRYS
jgi:hypothetical protein